MIGPPTASRLLITLTCVLQRRKRKQTGKEREPSFQLYREKGGGEKLCFPIFPSAMWRDIHVRMVKGVCGAILLVYFLFGRSAYPQCA